MLLSNIEMEQRLESLAPVLEQSGMIGYAAARNYRRLKDQLIEYTQRKEDLIRKYGIQEGGQYSIMPAHANFPAFEQELVPFATMEHEVEIMTRPMSEAAGVLTGKQIVDIWWMLDDDMEGK